MLKFEECKEFYGVRIPVEATKAVFGRRFGVYFLIGDEWYFMVFPKAALRASGADPDFNIYDHIRDGDEPKNV